ncbi:MAG TPA: HNH endonuclease, partial [Acidimicrobiales bacterium]|nr:HNH endonuclease [Acidimicrobiales bacterium]
MGILLPAVDGSAVSKPSFKSTPYWESEKEDTRMEDPARRFERHVDRTGEHHLWTGARDAARGTGRLKVEGRHVTAHRHAWELAHGPLPASAKVFACPEEPACVRVDHLRVEGMPESQRPAPRARKGTGSIRQVRPGVWKLAVTAPAGVDGGGKRVH